MSTDDKTTKKLVISTVDILKNKELFSDEERLDFVLMCFSALEATFTLDEKNYREHFPEDLRIKLEHNKLIRKAK